MATSESLSELSRQQKAQLSDLSNRQKENIKKLYAKYDKQKEFISIAAHELRSPIVPILGILELIEYEFEETGKKEITLKREHFETIVRNTKRLERLASEILDVSRIADHSLTLRKEYFNLSEVVLDAIKDYRQQIEKSNCNTKLLYEFKNKQGENELATVENNIFVYADKGRITQVIYNLLGNAVKFTHEGNVSISVMKNKHKNNTDEVILSVRDTGTGIHPDIISRLFTVFATKSETGTGLGLFISKNIVEAHGGNMWGENNTNGKGATFAFRLSLEREN